ncbi:MAG: ABC transporter ATP-binding protein, partial [Hyphomicrobiales bacterium]|nr:ABC transporter ATP-binding protein [Hyphomicrobiales bacterium]
LAIERGQVLGLVGESGCGKTTLARAILGVLPRDSARITGGRVLFRGSDLLTADPADVNRTVRGRAITFVPQDPFTSFNPVFTVGEQIIEVLKWKSPRASGPPGPGWLPALAVRYPRERKRADFDAILELLDAVQLPRPKQLLAKYPHELSGGQRQRLMIAMALLPGPDLVIADEPTTALDVTIQAQILKLLIELKARTGAAVILITHDLGVVAETCRRVIVMYAGRKVEEASVEALFEHPAHPYTQGLMAATPRRGAGAAVRRLAEIRGLVPSLREEITGCPFAPRCALAEERCRREAPRFSEIAPGHGVACFVAQRAAA